MAIKGGWTSIEQVPLLAWFRLKSNQKDVYPIQQINLQHLNTAFIPGSPPPKASPAVKINEQFWRPEELSAAFEVSLDGLTWQECVGEVGGRGSLVDRLARIEAALAANKGKISDDVAAALKEVIQATATNLATMTAHGQEIAALKDAVASLQRRDELTKEIDQIDAGLKASAGSEKLPAGNFAQPGSEPPKANPGAKPPEPKK